MCKQTKKQTYFSLFFVSIVYFHDRGVYLIDKVKFPLMVTT